MRVLVAGGAGFIGSHVCERLLEEGHGVVCVDNLSTSSGANLAQFVDDARFSFIKSDVGQTPDLDVDLVLHLASPASPIYYGRRPIETMLANSYGTRRLLEIAAANNARFLYASTSEIYGDPVVHPQPETYWGNVNPNGPRACYDESKRFGEAMVFSYQRQLGVNVGVIRIFNTYGPRMAAEDGRAIPAFVGAALSGEPIIVHGDGSQTRSFCYVSDLVRGLLLVALDRDADGCVFNIGNPEEVSVLDLANLINARTDNRAGVQYAPRPQDDPERRRPDISRMIDRYDWSPRISLEDGISPVITYFRGARADLPVAMRLVE